MESNKHIIGYDRIRIIAMLMVVGIHTNVAYLAANVGTAGWYLVMEITALYLVAVPLYFMISGATLLTKESSESPYLQVKKRLKKQGIPFLVWSLIYIFFRIIMGKVEFSAGTFLALLNTPAYYQFWFMYTLLAIYLLLPILQPLVQKLSRVHIEYLLLLWIFFSVVQPTLERVCPVLKISEHIDLVLCEGYIGYFFLGHYLRSYWYKIPVRKAIGISLLGLFITGTAAFLEYVCYSEVYAGFFYQSYLTPGVVIATSGLFLAFQNAQWRRGTKLCSKLADLSIGVYYVHMICATALSYVGLAGENSVVLLSVKLGIVYLCSLAAAFLIAKIPIARGILLGMPERNENEN